MTIRWRRTRAWYLALMVLHTAVWTTVFVSGLMLAVSGVSIANPYVLVAGLVTTVAGFYRIFTVIE